MFIKFCKAYSLANTVNWLITLSRPGRISGKGNQRSLAWNINYFVSLCRCTLTCWVFPVFSVLHLFQMSSICSVIANSLSSSFFINLASSSFCSSAQFPNSSWGIASMLPKNGLHHTGWHYLQSSVANLLHVLHTHSRSIGRSDDLRRQHKIP